MTGIYDHLPREIKCIKFVNTPEIINAITCPKQELRPCKEAGICCLGKEVSCAYNCCHNNKE